MKTINIILDSKEVKMPKYETEGAAGLDLRAYKYALPEDLTKNYEFPKQGLTLNSLDRVLVNTGIKIEVPKGYEVQIRPRGGLAARNGIYIHFGTVDEDYQGDICPILFNLGRDVFTIHKGDRIAQMVIKKVEQFELKEAKNFRQKTKRGDGAFGHTGVK